MLASLNRLSRGQRWLVGAGVVVVLLLVWFFGIRKPEAKRPPPPNPWMGPTPVHVVAVSKSNLKVHLKAIGTVSPLNTVTVRPRVGGPIISVKFSEGQLVKAGEVLAEIDPAPYQVKLHQAEGSLQETRAQLKNAQDDLALYERLLTNNSIAKQQYDKQKALVDQLQGTLKSHSAQLEDARLQLSYTRITAPIAGRTGLRKVDVGNLVNANDTTGLVTITQTKPISVVFTIPENQLMAVRQANSLAIANKQALSVEAWDRSEQNLLATGKLTTLDNQIDTATGTLRLKAEFDNGDDGLFPNQFINARLHLQTLDGAVTIPADAVQYGTKGTYVYVIDDGKAKMRQIKLGALEADRIAVLEGLKEGEQVVLEGIDRLWEGKDVKVM
ncbi:MdtA/MuxA family multidrug efflux RND transporter periplasmic adaptor subunit [Cellvibrio mixtus]|uniref:MdtA/MuxA family multidrug efflux RND transporter periplasmic adaptor subunit n=1 Tax=Cellvibrio mixtus TaxID=39650 RepID=UPI0005870828|nr:MdtA/MuxA family multidrug efflux RND transporter periplasmic adaptor subunit [Cellvibrio mixtus]